MATDSDCASGESAKWMWNSSSSAKGDSRRPRFSVRSSLRSSSHFPFRPCMRSRVPSWNGNGLRNSLSCTKLCERSSCAGNCRPVYHDLPTRIVARLGQHVKPASQSCCRESPQSLVSGYSSDTAVTAFDKGPSLLVRRGHGAPCTFDDRPCHSLTVVPDFQVFALHGIALESQPSVVCECVEGILD